MGQYNPQYQQQMFLSTPPSRVATFPRMLSSQNYSVSIHATLAGGDFGLSFCDSIKKMFLSTPPSRVATSIKDFYWWCVHVSIHATLAGGDHRLSHRLLKLLVVSIHATLAGGDHAAFVPTRSTMSVSIHATLAGGDLSKQISDGFCNTVSIHATLAGGDNRMLERLIELLEFLSTPPSRVATNPAFLNNLEYSCFYPRHPRGWRRRHRAADDRRWLVSIHATLAGGDFRASRYCSASFLFLSTPPSRVATCIIQKGGNLFGSFYPRHPRGWRQLFEGAIKR